ncbi:methyltransferase domain-containing protein [Aquihabitans sp. McL0605]|uniref:methyltransferase domain-containing protein n=1 Tax=Aquihabitans sp. McL0605 TaxID=3415671 RepID=UPI003CF7F815
MLDLLQQFAPDGSRPAVSRQAAIRSCELAGDAWAARLVTQVPGGATLDPVAIDRLEVEVHREIARLSRVTANHRRMRWLLAPVVDGIRQTDRSAPIRIVDLGCGDGDLVRSLARRPMGADLELVGIDLNPMLVDRARSLAAAEGLACRFEVGDARAPRDDATILTSTALLHHLRGPDLDALFAAQSAGSAEACVHLDLRPDRHAVAAVAAAHLVLMRSPVSRHDGVRSAQRAHPIEELIRAARGAEGFAFRTRVLSRFDPLCSMLNVLVGVRTPIPSAGTERAEISEPASVAVA